MKKILCVCLGNICRSPLAAGVLNNEAQRLGVSVLIESAGTANYHVGGKADKRSIEIGMLNGININNHRAQQFSREHFHEFNLILVMDPSNYSDVLKLANSEEQRKKVHFYDPNQKTVEDPYYGDLSDFETMYQHLVQHASYWIKKVEISD
jgi:protein-tyrosine phosphatase